MINAPFLSPYERQQLLACVSCISLAGLAVLQRIDLGYFYSESEMGITGGSLLNAH